MEQNDRPLPWIIGRNKVEIKDYNIRVVRINKHEQFQSCLFSLVACFCLLPSLYVIEKRKDKSSPHPKLKRPVSASASASASKASRRYRYDLKTPHATLVQRTKWVPPCRQPDCFSPYKSLDRPAVVSSLRPG